MPQEESVARVNFYDLMLLLTKWWKLFVINFVLAAAASVIAVFSLPVWYQASTIILPPAGGGGGLPSFLSQDIAGIAASFGLETPTVEIYQTILQSRSLKEKLIEKFNIRKVYKVAPGTFPEDLMRAFEKNMSVITREDQSIVVSFYDKDPERAANLANAAVDELDRLYGEITSNSAHLNRVFIGERLQEVKDSISVLQDSLIGFQRRWGLVSLSDQVTAMITAAADLKAQQLANDIQMNVIKEVYGVNHPKVVELRRTSEEMGRRFRAVLDGSQSELFFALDSLPVLTREYADIMREIRVQSSLLEFIYPQFESARISETRERANVQVLDHAQKPNKKAKPPRRLIVMVACGLSILASILIVLGLEYWRRLPEANPNDYDKIRRIIGNLKVRG